MTSETPHTDVLRSSDIAFDVPNGRNIPPIGPACPYGSCEKSSRKYVYKYMNEYLDLPGIINIWDGKVAYYDDNACSVFHGGAWDMDQHTMIVQFNDEGNEDWLGSVSYTHLTLPTKRIV